MAGVHIEAERERTTSPPGSQLKMLSNRLFRPFRACRTKKLLVIVMQVERPI